jgi:hypothetical protein
MALERFIPKSPDMFIRNSQDFEVAKFGHLNTIVEYINSYIGSDSLQLAGSGPITSTARYISDSTGVNSAISISTIRVGIGTDIPSAELHIDGHNGFGASLKITTNKVNSVAYVQMISDYVTGFEQYQYGGPGWGWPNWTTTRAGGTAAAPTAVPNNYGLNEYTFWGHDGTAGGQAYAMMTRSSETWTPTAHGIYTIFSTVATGSTSLVERMRFSAGGNITFNNASDTAKVSIKGSGSTSATTALLVQNSATTQLFRVYDDGTTDVGASLHFYPSGLIYTDFGSLQLQGATRVQINNSEVLATANDFSWANNNFLPSNSTRNNFKLVGNGSSFTNGGASGTSIGNALSIPIGMSTAVGNVTLNHININGTINTTGGTTLQRGFYYNPTLTGTVGFTHNAIETVSGNVLLATTSGNVGIGTTTPLGKLHVNGISFFYSGSSYTQIQGNLIYLDGGTGILSQDYLKSYINGFSVGTIPANNFHLLTSNTERLTISGTGNVGINTTSPTAKLQIVGSGSTSATTSLLVQNSLGRNLIQLRDDGASTVNGDLYVSSPSFTGSLLFQCIGNNQQQIRGAYGENITFGTGGNTMSLNATEVYVSNNFYGPAHGLTTGGLCLGALSGPVASAQLEMRSTTKGFLMPRMTTAEINAIASPANGLQVYNTTLAQPCFYDGVAWRKVTHSTM